MKPIQIIKTVLFVIGGVLIIVFHDALMADEASYVGLIVGLVVVFYGLSMTVDSIVSKKYFGENKLFFGALSQFLIATALFVVSESIYDVCLVWAVWSILREGKEASEALHAVVNKKPGILNIIESIIVIYFSFVMILDPGEHHASFHLYLLGVELFLEVFFPMINHVHEYFINKKKTAKLQAKSQTNAETDAAATQDGATDTEKNRSNN